MSLLEEKITLYLDEGIQKNYLPLPSLPKQAIDIMALEDELELSPLIDALKKSASVSFALYALANLLTGKQEAQSYTQLIEQLGLEDACTQAARIASKQMIQPVQSMIDKKLRTYSDMSFNSARIAAKIANEHTNLSADFAFLAGLFCNIGVLPIIAYANDHEADIQDSISLEKIIQTLQLPFSIKLLQQGRFDDKLIQVSKEYNNFERDISEPDYSCIVQIATLLAQGPTDFNSLRALKSSQCLGINEHTDEQWHALIK